MTAALLVFENLEYRPGARGPARLPARVLVKARHATPRSALAFDRQERQPFLLQVTKLAIVVGLHAALVVWLAGVQPGTPVAPVPVRMAVRSIEISRPAVANPAAEAPQPLPHVSRPVKRRPQAATPSQVMAATAPSVDAATSVAVAPQPAMPATEVAAVAPSAPAPVAAPAPLTGARFDADYLQNPAPSYPAMSRRLREEGQALLDVRVSATGEPEHVRLKQSSGFARLDEVAINTVQRWRFSPARRGDEAIAASVVVPIVFRLDS